MCGIAGFMSTDGSQPPASMLTRMLSAIAHRGPDGEGKYAAGGVAMGQKRLAIIDLKTGDQPLFGPNETALVANGEIYNYLELKRDLAGSSFSTSSDCEPPLFIYAREGANYARALRGMYAIALRDERNSTLQLSRDPFGIKPLYYAEGAWGIAFASEPQALIAAGLLKPDLVREKAMELLQLQFTTGQQTIFRGIQRVLPGETLELRGGRVEHASRLAALPHGLPVQVAEDEALKQLDRVLMNSVDVHQHSDVPYGMFLSGGIDSSAVLACMARLNERAVRAFTAGFPRTAVADEREHARAVAKAAGAEHIEITVTADDFWRNLPAIVAAIDDPAADYAIIPTYFLAAEAAKDLKVILSGEGGDELFSGYGRYRSAMRPRLLGGRPMRRRGLLDGFGLLRDTTPAWREGIASAERRAKQDGRTKLQMAQAVDCEDWLPHDLLIKLDRCLMAHAVEGRTPFLDREVAAFAFRLPDGLKIRNGLGKYLLRRWLERALPESRPFEPKRGFTVPVAEWIAEKAATLAPLVARSPGIASICNPDAVAALFRSLSGKPHRRAGMACWQLLFYALWHHIHVEGGRSDAPVIETFEKAR